MAPEQPDLEKNMTPEQVREARQAYAAQYGHEAFQTQLTTQPNTTSESKPATTPTVPEPHIEPPGEREMQGAELQALREQAGHIQNEGQ